MHNWNTSESVDDSKKIMDDINEMFPSVTDTPKVWND